MNENTSFGGEWIFAFLIIAVIFGWGGNGFGHYNNGGGSATLAGYATTSDITAAINAQTNGFNQQQILLSSANNNYETARLISDQNATMMAQNNTNQINMLQSFNGISAQIANQTNILSSKLDQLGFNMEQCCCSIKNLIKDNQIADLTNQLNHANNAAINASQSQYLLSQMGRWSPYAPVTPTATT